MNTRVWTLLKPVMATYREKLAKHVTVMSLMAFCQPRHVTCDDHRSRPWFDGRHGWIATYWISKSNKFSAAVQGDFPVHDDRNKFTCVVVKLNIALFVLWSFHRFRYRYHKLIMSQSSSVFRPILRACLHGRRVPRLAGLPAWKGWNIARLNMQLT